MGDVTLAARALLFCIFAVAALAKLLARDTSSVEFRDFGVPARIAKLTEPLLVPAELAVATSLLIQPTARIGAVAATLLLLIFIAGVANALRNGRRPQCGCFGGLHAEPIGNSTLVRNALLTAVAAFAAATGPGTGLGRWLSAGSHIAITGGLAVAVMATLVARGRLRAASPTPDAPASVRPPVKNDLLRRHAPAFDLDGACGPRQTLDSLSAEGLPLVLVFGDAG